MKNEHIYSENIFTLAKSVAYNQNADILAISNAYFKGEKCVDAVWAARANQTAEPTHCERERRNHNPKSTTETS